jgi:hypothetical protein
VCVCLCLKLGLYTKRKTCEDDISDTVRVCVFVCDFDQYTKRKAREDEMNDRVSLCVCVCVCLCVNLTNTQRGKPVKMRLMIE